MTVRTGTVNGLPALRVEWEERTGLLHPETGEMMFFTRGTPWMVGIPHWFYEKPAPTNGPAPCAFCNAPRDNIRGALPWIGLDYDKHPACEDCRDLYDANDPIDRELMRIKLDPEASA